MARYNIDIAAFSEARLSDEGQLIETDVGYAFFWKNKLKGEKRVGDVSFAVRTELTHRIEQPNGFSDSVIYFPASLSCNRFMIVISLYAPILDSSSESVMASNEGLRSVIISIPNVDKILFLGDSNARSRCDYETWDTLRRHSLGNMNANGLRLLQFCSELDLIICNTSSSKATFHKATWTHSRSKRRHILDYLKTRTRDLQDVYSVHELC